MSTIEEIIKDGDWCISRTGHNYLISVEDWQILKAAVPTQQTNNSRVIPCPVCDAPAVVEEVTVCTNCGERVAVARS